VCRFGKCGSCCPGKWFWSETGIRKCFVTKMVTRRPATSGLRWPNGGFLFWKSGKKKGWRLAGEFMYFFCFCGVRPCRIGGHGAGGVLGGKMFTLTGGRSPGMTPTSANRRVTGEGKHKRSHSRSQRTRVHTLLWGRGSRAGGGVQGLPRGGLSGKKGGQGS